MTSTLVIWFTYLWWSEANYNTAKTQLVTPQLKEYECLQHQKIFTCIHVQLLLTYLPRPFPSQPCRQEEVSTPPPLLPMMEGGEQLDEVCRVLQCVVTWYRIWIPWAHDHSHPQTLWLEFLQRTENLNAHDNGVLVVEWNWTGSTIAMPCNTHSHR